ncbi:HAMP domain-containing histidine kinase [Vibrio sp. JC009]|uniref:sensor histidine kinase n=1 Tax=Vibrio sp. JC009 TaxID=2912314 RepID=UPI0023B0669C|nr:HAMP domain-containing sensor histidine kinase [Vibrio sp. JC009]WED24858.1 HAMP domain-containing histidine kinase [Vibrio sp. JC009]
MAKLIPPMFARLYISMIASLCAGIFLTFQLMQSYLEKDSIEDFVRDTQYVYQNIQQNLKSENMTTKAFFESKHSPIPHFQFELMLLDQNSPQPPCKKCTFLSSVKGVKVYGREDGRMSSVYTLPDSKHLLIISDRAPLEIAETDTPEWYQDEEELLPFILFAVTLLVIAGVLYYPTRRLHKQIETLILTQNQFGKGNLNTRADEDIPAPLNDLAANFNLMAEEIDNKVSESLVFAQAVPHEIRTPLSRIQLASGLLRKTCQEKSQSELLDNIDSYIDDLEDLTNQVVAYSRLNSASPADRVNPLQPIALKAFILSRLEALQPRPGIEVELDIDNDSFIQCDAMHFRLLMDNLLKNALLHTHSRIVVSEMKQSGQQILSVADDGPGIPEDKQQYVFVPFARLDKSRDRKTGGLGLGLAIASSAAKKLDGTLTVTSSNSGGAKFVLTCEIRQQKKAELKSYP